MFDTSELAALANDLGKVPGKVVPAVIAATTQSGEALRAAWAANAAATAGEHGKHYPRSITADPLKVAPFVGVSVEVGPDNSKPQGGMGRGFEFGSANQPPHLDGHRAADVVGPQYAEALARAVAGTFEAAVTGGSARREFTTKSGTTRMATEAQIAHWTRGSTS